MNVKTVLLIGALLAAPSIGSAHGPKVGANGGPQVDAGDFHVEIVPQATMLQVYLRDQSDQAVKTEGYKGVAIFVVDGKPQRIPLVPAGENRLSGTSSRQAPGRTKRRRADHDSDREHDSGQVRLTNILCVPRTSSDGQNVKLGSIGDEGHQERVVM